MVELSITVIFPNGSTHTQKFWQMLNIKSIYLCFVYIYIYIYTYDKVEQSIYRIARLSHLGNLIHNYVKVVFKLIVTDFIYSLLVRDVLFNLIHSMVLDHVFRVVKCG